MLCWDMGTKGFGLRISAAGVAHSVHSPRAIVGDNIGHVLVCGIDDRGKDLIIAREYISRGLAGRAAELVNLDLGPHTDREIFEGRQREIMQERFSGIDRKLLLARETNGLVSAWHDSVEQSRLDTLSRMGLATEEAKGRYRLAEDLEVTLRTMGRRGDIIATKYGALRQRASEIAPQDHAIYDPAEGKPLVGRVVARGLADEHNDRHYMIVAATDGGSRYIELGVRSVSEMLERPEIVKVTPVMAAIREVDRTIAEVAATHGGIYSIDNHLHHDANATQRFAEAHVRRLEAMRWGRGDVADACRATGIGRSKFYELIKAGEIEVIKVGAITLVPMFSIQALHERGRPAAERAKPLLTEAMHQFLADAILTASTAETSDAVRRDLSLRDEGTRAKAEDSIVEQMIAALHDPRDETREAA